METLGGRKMILFFLPPQPIWRNILAKHNDSNSHSSYIAQLINGWSNYSSHTLFSLTPIQKQQLSGVPLALTWDIYRSKCEDIPWKLEQIPRVCVFSEYTLHHHHHQHGLPMLVWPLKFPGRLDADLTAGFCDVIQRDIQVCPLDRAARLLVCAALPSGRNASLAPCSHPALQQGIKPRPSCSFK